MSEFMMPALRHFKCFNMVGRTTNPLAELGLTKIYLTRTLSTKIKSKEESKSTADMLFERFRADDVNLMSVGKFLAGLKQEGIRKKDPRLAGLMENLKKLYKISGRTGKSPTTQKLTREEFKDAIAPSFSLISRAFRRKLVIPAFGDFTRFLEENYWKCKPNVEGRVADYIPQLARVNPNYWAASVCTIDGQRFSIGDVHVPFTVQSTSKPITYGIALDHLMQEVVHQYIGQEPSGRNFNELVLDYNKKPHNPMVNAGAIVVCSLLIALVYPNMTQAEKFDFTKNIFQRLAGGEYIGFNNAVFLSEREAADRNYALGFYMRENKCFPEKSNLKEVMDFYFQCCSLEATCDSAAVMAATLANGGICPLTDDQVLKPDAVRDVLSLMHSCGMYDYSGQFAFKVGLPAKSGVSGALMIVIPNVLGICLWSPPLDQLGNSVRGVQFCESAITKLALLNSHSPLSKNLMSILMKNPHITHPELVRMVNARNFDKLKQEPESTPFKKRTRRHEFSQCVNLINLLFSSANGDIAALRMHWLSGSDMTASDYDGRTALHLASAEGHLECVKFLLQQCEVPHDQKDRWDNTPLDEAKTFKRVQVIEFITKHAAKEKSKPSTEQSGPKDPPKKAEPPLPPANEQNK